MKIEELKIISAVFQESNLTKIAERFHISQSNLSKIIMKTERELGFKLFERKGFKGLRPTQQGALFAERLPHFARFWDDTVALVRNFEQQRIDVKVTGPSLYMRNIFLPKWFGTDLAENHRLTYVQSRLDQIALVAQSGDLDLVITPSPFELLDWVPIQVFSEKFAVFSADRKVKSLADLDLRSRPWLAYRASNEILFQFFHQQQISLQNISAYIDDIESILDVLQTHPEMLSLLPAHAAHTHPSLSCIPVKQNAGQNLFMMYRSTNAPVAALAKILKKLLHEAP